MENPLKNIEPSIHSIPGVHAIGEKHPAIVTTGAGGLL